MPPRATPAPPPSEPQPPEPLDEIHPIRLARMLGEKWSGLSESAREVCMAELIEGGVLAPRVEKKSPVEQFVKLPPGQEERAELKMEVMRTRLKMNEARYSGPLDLLDVLGLLADLAGHVSVLGGMLSTVWPAWHGLARNARIQPSATSRLPLMDQLRDALDGRPTGDLACALRDQHTAARLLIAILSGLGQGSQAFARECSQFIDPEGIQRELRKSKGRTPTVEEMWARFKQLSNLLSPSEIEHRLQQHVITAAETFFHAAHRP